MMMSPRRRKVNDAVIFDVSAWFAGGKGDAAKKRKKFLIVFFFGLCGFWLGVLGLIYGMGGGAFLIWAVAGPISNTKETNPYLGIRDLEDLG